MPICKNRDFKLTILELIVVIFIMAILSVIAIPNYKHFMMHQEREATLNTLKTLIEYGKNEAFHQNKTITLCVSADGRHCSRGFGATVLVFENDAGHAHPRPNTLLQTQGQLQYGQLVFTGFAHDHASLNINANGLTHNNGSFTYCPKNGDSREADALIINKASRSYRPTVRNSLGILLKEEGTGRREPLSCL